MALGVNTEVVFTDQGVTRTNRARPGLWEALAACRGGDTLVVTELDRLARSLRDAKGLADVLARRAVELSIGGSVHDHRPGRPVAVHRAIQRAGDTAKQFAKNTATISRNAQGRRKPPTVLMG